MNTPKARHYKELKDAYFWLLVYFVIGVCIKVLSYYPGWIESQYSTNWYGGLSRFFRAVLGVMPISIGDVLYAYWVVLILIIIADVVKGLLKRDIEAREFHYASVNNIKSLLLIYIAFNALWGLNYNRLGIEHQLDLKPTAYTKDELQDLTNTLIVKVNTERKKMGENYKYPEYEKVFKHAYAAYQYVAADYPFLEYRRHSIKKSLYGKLGNYVGFVGYYNPFTAEAQVNVTVPPFMIPFTTCHEIAHQIGYASESEASFVGFLAAKASDETLLHYSAYFDLFLYANAEMHMKDSVLARKNFQKLDTLVKKDIQELRTFHKEHESFIEPYTRSFYDEYLKFNNQPKGLKTYNEVVAWLIAYRKQYNDF